MKITSIGGQAVIEGVMMRGKKMYAMAVRRPDGTLCIEKEPINDVFNKNSIFKLPIFRGVAAFVQSLVIGVKIITRSSQIAGLEDDSDDIEPGKFEKFLQRVFGDKLGDLLIYFSVLVSLVFSIGLFFVLPVIIGSWFKNIVPGTWAIGIVEGLVRMGIFLAYLILISRMKEINRVFRYHGAEHKTINCFEHDEELTVENVKKYKRFHKRCGTSFLLIVMIISMLVFFFVRTDTITLRIISRVLLVPVVAGISYEVLKWAGRSDSFLVKIVSAPGLCLQRITTAEPDAGQIEAAIAAMKGVLEDEPE
ncbi:MAG: DUF1385 domain-containing protein [Clostridia bacterium]|jgi:uncharacterized protein YqhQ|nr:DUF1385 domain-containing protein [Clostridia bacterium]MCI1998906.1 DUF1385 domain-containing protein [Clostridia bacterium]MCI2013656.1 DUF1385 domain-containing protein [Clostridia bacterium]